MITLTRTYSFEAAHQLHKHLGKCKNLHGHSYHGELTISGPIDSESGMIIDFKDFGNIIQTYIIEKYDHKYLNDLFTDTPPTAEVLADEIFTVFGHALHSKYSDLLLEEVVLYETEDSKVTVRRPR